MTDFRLHDLVQYKTLPAMQGRIVGVYNNCKVFGSYVTLYRVAWLPSRRMAPLGFGCEELPSRRGYKADELEHVYTM